MNFLQILLLLTILMFHTYSRRARGSHTAPFLEQIQNVEYEEDEEEDEEEEEEEDSDEDDEHNDPPAQWGPPEWEDVYLRHMKDRAIRVERKVLTSLRPNVIKQLSDRKWLKIGELASLCYEEIVRRFYASACFLEDGTIVATVRGIQVFLTPSRIATLIEAPLIRKPSYPLPKDAFDNDPSLFGKIGAALTNGVHGFFQKLPQGDLTIDYQFLHLIVTHNLLAVGRNSDTSWDRAVFMYCVMHDYTINLPRVIFNHIANFINVCRRKNEQLIYGTLISLACTQAGVPVLDSDLVHPNKGPIGGRGFKDKKSKKSKKLGASSSRGDYASASVPSDLSWVNSPPSVTAMSACSTIEELSGAMTQFSVDQHNVNDYQNRCFMELFRQRGSDDSQHRHQ